MNIFQQIAISNSMLWWGCFRIRMLRQSCVTRYQLSLDIWNDIQLDEASTSTKFNSILSGISSFSLMQFCIALFLHLWECIGVVRMANLYNRKYSFLLDKNKLQNITEHFGNLSPLGTYTTHVWPLTQFFLRAFCKKYP